MDELLRQIALASVVTYLCPVLLSRPHSMESAIGLLRREIDDMIKEGNLPEKMKGFQDVELQTALEYNPLLNCDASGFVVVKLSGTSEPSVSIPIADETTNA